MASLEETAQLFKQLHKPGQPLVLANVYDGISARTVAKLPTCKALATASYAVAQAHNTTDDDLDLETNLRACQTIADVAREFQKPLTVDLQDGYGDQLEEAISRLVKMGVVGINLEDYDNTRRELYSVETATTRIKRALAAAANQGLANFVVNARCDGLLHSRDLSEVISRGKAYLEAGATTVFVWGGRSRGISRQEVDMLVEAFGGKLNVSLKSSEDGLSIKQLADIGVARISMGPALQLKAMDVYGREADRLLGQL
jgi:2-methylisocitrate lyase-like PEP mutase family enzyme